MQIGRQERGALCSGVYNKIYLLKRGSVYGVALVFRTGNIKISVSEQLRTYPSPNAKCYNELIS